MPCQIEKPWTNCRTLKSRKEMVESREICHENLVPHTHVQSPPSHQIQSRKKCSNVVHLTPLLICWVPVIVHGSCISVSLYFCTSASLYACISVFRAWHHYWCVDLFCRFSVWGPEVRLSCRDGGQGGSLGGRRLRRGPGGHLSWGDILVATCLSSSYFSTISFLCKNAKDMSN